MPNNVSKDTIHRHEMRFRIADAPEDTWGLMADGKEGDIAIVNGQIQVTWKREKHGAANVPAAFLGPIASLVVAVAEWAHNEREGLWIDPEASRAYYDHKRAEMSLLLPDGYWLATSIIDRNEFPLLVGDLEEILGDRIIAERLGRVDGDMKKGLRILLVFLVIAGVVSYVLSRIY